MTYQKRVAITLLVGSLAFSGAACAGNGYGHKKHHDDHRGHRYHDGRGPQYDYAKVIGVTPITRIIETSRPERECWQEEVVHEARGDANLGGMILGGVVGGVVGNRFGGGNGKKVATVAGTLAGAAIGQELARGPRHGYSTYEDRCRTYRTSYTEERVVGYDVRYRYNGQEYVTRTDHDPGSHIKVRVNVTPMM